MNESIVYNWMPPELVRALCWTLIHSLWLGVVVAVMAGLIVAATRKSRPLIRYNLFVSVLFVFTVSVLIVFFKEYRISTLTVADQENIITTTGTGSNTATAAITARPTGSSMEPVIDYFNNQAGWIVLGWTLIFLFQLARLFAGLHYIHRIRTVRTEAMPLYWQQKARALSQSLGIRQHIRFLQSALVKVPVVVGMLRPVILLPVGLVTQLDPKYVEAILLHELAHIRRKDYFVNLLQSLMESIFFFNPAVLWISALIREEREACCDDIVLASTADKQNYLKALLCFQEQESSFAMALHTRKAYLLHRVKRMLTNENKKLNIMERIILISGLLLFSAFALLPAQEVKKTLPPLPVAEQPATPPAPSVPPVPEQKFTEPAAQKKPVKFKEPMPVLPARPEKPEHPALPPVPVKDTVPAAKSKITSMSTNMHDDGNTKTSVITAITTDGKTYLIKRVNGETVLLSVDGQNIPKEEMNQYNEVLQDIESRERLAKEKRAQAEQKRQQVNKQRQQEMAARRDEQMKRKFEFNKKNQEESKKQQERNKNITKVQNEHRKKQEHKRIVAVTNKPNEVSGIIEELSREKLISGDNLSFSLTEKELIVNGSRQDAALQQKLKEKYNLKPGDYIQYKKDGGNTTTSINRN